MRAVLLDVDPDLRDLLTGLSNAALIATCAALVDERGEAVFTMRLLALRIQNLSAEVKELTRRNGVLLVGVIVGVVEHRNVLAGELDAEPALDTGQKPHHAMQRQAGGRHLVPKDQIV